MPPAAAAAAKAQVPTESARNLQERLHELISRLSSTSDIVKTWPETKGDDASIHVERTTKLIASIRQVIAAIEKVEGTIQADLILKKTLQETLVPLDLLDLLDCGGGLNPDCFSRGLVREALGQLAGLKRRKLALEMLGAAVQSGINRKNAQTATAKRERDETSDGGPEQEPPAKKQKGL